jgi:hypothetical protein
MTTCGWRYLSVPASAAIYELALCGCRTPSEPALAEEVVRGSIRIASPFKLERFVMRFLPEHD